MRSCSRWSRSSSPGALIAARRTPTATPRPERSHRRRGPCDLGCWFCRTAADRGVDVRLQVANPGSGAPRSGSGPSTGTSLASPRRSRCRPAGSCRSRSIREAASARRWSSGSAMGGRRVARPRRRGRGGRGRRAVRPRGRRSLVPAGRYDRRREGSRLRRRDEPVRRRGRLLGHPACPNARTRSAPARSPTSSCAPSAASRSTLATWSSANPPSLRSSTRPSDGSRPRRSVSSARRRDQVRPSAYLGTPPGALTFPGGADAGRTELVVMSAARQRGTSGHVRRRHPGPGPDRRRSSPGSRRRACPPRPLGPSRPRPRARPRSASTASGRTWRSSGGRSGWPRTRRPSPEPARVVEDRPARRRRGTSTPEPNRARQPRRRARGRHAGS